MDNADFDFEIFKIFDKEKTISEETLFGKIVNSDITRTDVMTFLLQDDLTFNYEKVLLVKFTCTVHIAVH